MAQPYDLPLEQLRQYQPGLTKQPDFEAFWERTLSELREVSPDYTLEPMAYPTKGVKVYRILYKRLNHAQIEGRLAMPDREGPHPGIVLYHGYNSAYDGNIHDTVVWALRGYAALQMLVRGQQGESEDNVVSPHGGPKGWLTKGIRSPETYYYRAVYMDAVRALEVLANLPEVNETRLGTVGGSQGGALAIAAAALSPLPKVVASDYPFLSHFERAIDITPEGPYLELNEYFRRYPDPRVEENAKRTLSYFDVMNLAPRVAAFTWMSVGIVDLITPPSTVFAVYNHLSCPKDLYVARYFGHEYIPGAVERRLSVLMEHLQHSGAARVLE
ncbi:acetylxylan esterase [Laceyella putida]|uniref:Acetylxylan esterase n=1 Tax=Laceyella putida TaxID=110101 RepID=A0ABW2RQI5_9BACL